MTIRDKQRLALTVVILLGIGTVWRTLTCWVGSPGTTRFFSPLLGLACVLVADIFVGENE